jgi:hypothetical protein
MQDIYILKAKQRNLVELFVECDSLDNCDGDKKIVMLLFFYRRFISWINCVAWNDRMMINATLGGMEEDTDIFQEMTWWY